MAHPRPSGSVVPNIRHRDTVLDPMPATVGLTRLRTRAFAGAKGESLPSSVTPSFVVCSEASQAFFPRAG